MKHHGLLLALAALPASPLPVMAQDATSDIVYESFEQRVCKLMPAPYAGQTVIDSMTGCQWTLAGADDQPVAGETLTATAAFNIDDDAYAMMFGYTYGGYLSEVAKSNGTARISPFDICQSEVKLGDTALPSSFRFDRDSPPSAEVQFHCGRVEVKISATGKDSVQQIEPLARAMETLVRTEQSELDQAPQ